MRRGHLARSIIKGLEEQIKVAEAKKKEIQEHLEKLKRRYASGKISYSEYVESVYLKREGLDLKEWVAHLEHHIWKCEKKISEKKKDLLGIHATNVLVFSSVLVFLIGAVFYLQPKFIGFVIQEQPTEFFDLLNLNFSESQVYTWFLNNPGKLESLKVSGIVEGEGSAKIYLGNLLIFDSSIESQNVKKSKRTITGFAVFEGNLSAGEIFDDSNQSIAVENATETNQSVSEELNNTEVSENQTEPPSQQEPLASEILVSEFADICEETCDLSSLNLSQENYDIRIEITGNASLKIERITYAVSKPGEIPEAPVVEENITNLTQTSILSENISQQRAVLGQPVKWTKTVQLDKKGVVKVRIPEEAKNINVNAIEDNEKRPVGRITGNVVSVDTGFLSRLGRITGNVIQTTRLQNEIELEISENATEYEIAYETPAPYAEETEIKNGKRVKVVGPETVHYENVLAFANLSEDLNIKNPSTVRIHWIENNTFISPEKISDLNNNGIYDYVEWTIPHLSNQTFSIIVITKAEHLDSNREFISDIYPEVFKLDNLWSETINDQEYVRVVFEIPLDSSRDITVFPRIVSGSPRIEVYEVDGNEIIAEFASVTGNEYNKVLLDGSSGLGLPNGYSQDTFDLKVINGEVEFDHIIDPISIYNYNSGNGTLHFVYENLNAAGNFPPSFSTGEGLAGTEITNYTKVQSDDGDYLTLAGGANTEPYFRFNFTIAESVANINWIFARINGFATFGGGEDADCFIANISGGAWQKICDMPTSDGNCDFNLTSDIADYINPSSQVVYVCEGKNLDPADNINVDFVNVTVDYNATVDNPPKWQNPSVNDSSPTPGISTVRHNINWTDDNGLRYAILEVNSSGASCDTLANVTTNSSFGGTTNWSNMSWLVPNGCEGKTIGWKQYANDSANQWNVTDLQTYNAQNVNPIATFGLNPVDAFNTSSQSITFDLKASDNLGLSYLVLYGNWNGTWLANQTNATPVNDSFWNITIEGIQEGKGHIWAAWGNDTLGNSAFTATNRTFTVDLTNPTSTINAPANNTPIKDNTPDINITMTDNFDPSITYNIWVDGALNKTGSVTNNSATNVTLDAQPDSQILVVAEAIDDSGRSTNSSTLYLTIDTTAPSVTLPVYSNGTTKTNNDNLDLNILVSDSGSGVDKCVTNIATSSTGNVTNTPSSGWCNFSYTLSGASEGNQIINAYANDTLNNMALNNSYVVNIDNAPTWSDNSTNSTKAGQAVKHNVLWADTQGLSGYIFSFDNGTGTFSNDTWVSLTETSNWSNVTKVANDTVGSTIRWIVYANDTSNNLNETDIFQYNTTLANEAPTIGFVEAIPATDPVIGDKVSITFNFTATDTNGAGDIDTSTAAAYFQRTGETTRSNASCINTTAGVGNDINFTCTIDMWYFDQNGAWTINATIQDSVAAYGENSSETFTYNLQTAMVMSPSSLTWSNIGVTSTDLGANENPIVINNSGNDVDLNINVTAFDLRGNVTTTEFIFANNFTVDNATAGCSGTAMVNASSINVTSAILQRGNNSLNYNNATSGQEQVYFCLKGVQTTPPISSQGYNSDYGVWVVQILAAYFLVFIGNKNNKKKKQKKKEDKLIESLDLLEYLHIVDKLKDKFKFTEDEIIRTIIDKASKKYNIGREELLNIIKAREGITIPVGIFTDKLGALESLAKYMKENLGMSYKEIAKELQRNERTIWTAYKKAAEKQKEPLKTEKSGMMVPISIFEDKELTVLESLIVHLKEIGLKYSEIGKLLGRDQRNIWTIHSRALKKTNEKNN